MAFGRKKTLLDRAQDAVEQVAESVIPTLESALEQTKEKAGPALADARERAKPLIEEGKARAAEGRGLAAAKVAELRAEEPEPEPKGGKLKKFLLFGGLLALAGVVFKKLNSSPDSANWQSSYVPTPPPAPAAPAAPAAAAPITGDPLTDPLPGEGDDVGGGAPGEAISDAVEEPHSPTTPDSPAEVIDVNDVPKEQ